jgi:UDP-N-acetylmuramoylalanine--D-glutamate ligase
MEAILNIRTYINEKYSGKDCRVLGFGRSNRPLVEILVSAGARVTVHDGDEGILNENQTKDLISRGVSFVLGEGYLSSLGGDFIFRSPGIRPDLPEMIAAINKGATLTSEMELFFEVCPCDIIGITGSDGKTTTTTVTHLLLKTELEKKGKGKAYVGGNIGAPLLPLVFDMTEDDVAVVELSSFQLQTMKRSPSRAVITNLSENHLNWHKNMGEYVDAKCNIYRHSPCTRLITNAENELTSEIAGGLDLPITYFSSKRTSYSSIVPMGKQNCSAVYEEGGDIYFDDGEERELVLRVSDIRIPGRHNVENYMTAIAVTWGLVSSETVSEIAKSFGGVEHRLELVREKDGIRYYNSSIDSSPTRTAAALSALDKAPIIICGGSEKNVEFDELARDLCTKVKAVVLTGFSAPHILAEIEKCPSYDKEKLTVKHIPTFDEAVLAAADMAEKGDIVLLSPACASFDAFKNFEERGNRFKTIINGL